MTDAIVRALPVPFLVLDASLAVRGASAQAFILFGLRRRDAAGSKAAGARLQAQLGLHGDLMPRLATAAATLSTARPETTFAWRWAGRSFRVSVFRAGAAKQGQVGVMFNERTADEQERRSHQQTRQYLEEVLNSLPLGVIVTDQQLRITFINQVQLHMLAGLGQQLEIIECLGHPLRTVLPATGDVDWQAVTDEVIANRHTWRKCQHVGAAGAGESEACHLSMSVTPLGAADQPATGTVCICQDVSRMIQMADDARQAELLAARFDTLRQVAVTINHQINNSLTTILMSAQIMQEFPEMPLEEQADLIDDIIAQADHIRVTTMRLKDIRNIASLQYLQGYDEHMLDPDQARNPDNQPRGEQS